jgi:DNA invertase Pin-like site-specific DNA recombinase
MMTIQDIINAKKRDRKRPDEGELRLLPFKHAFIYGRLSSPGQVRDSRESVREIARLVDLAINDGYNTKLNSNDVEIKLISVQQASTSEKIWSDGEVTVDVQDLGISGQLSFQDRKGLTELQRLVREGTVGAVYLTEGVSRLSRDKDRILPYQLLKLLKEYECRIRTLEGVWNPAIERDWDYLAEEFEDAIGELRVMNRRMFRRKLQKARRGEYVGEPIPPGFLLPVTGRKPSGEFEYGKMEPYPPHVEIVKQVLEEYIDQGGSRLKTLRALDGLTFPCFPPDLQYMERLTSLRSCPRTSAGYKITSTLIRGMATNAKMIGVWQWGDTEPIMDNHSPVVPEELFLEAWQLVNDNKKPKGRTINFEPMEWAGLLHCMNHREPHKIASLNSKGRYTCQRDYVQEASDVCLDITARFLDEPLTTTVLGQLDLTPFTEEILARLESDNDRPKLEERKTKQQVKKLEEEISKWQSLLPCCVDTLTGVVDKEKEQFYWGKIKEAQEQLDNIKAKPIPQNKLSIDFNKVREFLKGLTNNWHTYSLTSRNQLLKLIIDTVELRGSQDIEATIVWKTGFQQKVIIHRPISNSKLERRWTEEEDGLLRMMYPSSSTDILMAALTNRTWKAITLRARRLNLRRVKSNINRWQKWTREEDEQLYQLCRGGVRYDEIARKLGRSVDSVATRVRDRGLSIHRPNGTRKSRVHWEAYQLLSFQESSSRGGHRG